MVPNARGSDPRAVPGGISGTIPARQWFGRAYDDDMLFFKKKKAARAEFVPVVLADAVESDAPRKKILVVDDDPIIVKTLSMTLNAQGYQVVSATDGAEAIGVINKEDPDMMLVDVGLPPDLGGARLCDGF